MLLHTTIEKRRSRAFKRYKVCQNRTIIKEVRSKNVILLPQCPAGAGSTGAGPGATPGPDPLGGLGPDPLGPDPPGPDPGPDPPGPDPDPLDLSNPGVRTRDQPPGPDPGSGPTCVVPTPGVRIPGTNPGGTGDPLALARAIASTCYCIPPLKRGDRELSNDIKFVKIGPLLKKLEAKM